MKKTQKTHNNSDTSYDLRRATHCL